MAYRFHELMRTTITDAYGKQSMKTILDKETLFPLLSMAGEQVHKYCFHVDPDCAIYEELKMANGKISFSARDRHHKVIYQLKQLVLIH